MNDIIYIHTEQKGIYCEKIDYFRHVLETTKKYNPEANIHLLCDTKPNVTGITFYKKEDYNSPEIDHVRSIYKHMASNPYQFELECILRWFYVYNFCKKNNIQSIVYLDSDCMLLKNLKDIDFKQDVATNIVYNFVDHETIRTDIVTPHCHFIMNVEILKDYIDFTISQYETEHSKINVLYRELQRQQVAWGISDMFIWGLFCTDNRSRFLNIKGVIDGEIFETAIEDLEGMQSENGTKKIVKIEKDFYCENESGKIKMNCIHWHGGYKSRVNNFYYQFIK